MLHRVEELADRPAGYQPKDRPHATHLIQLHEILGELLGVGAKSKAVQGRLAELVARLGSELEILLHSDISAISRAGGAELGEAIARLRAGRVRREPGFDGEYGVISLRAPVSTEDGLFDVAPAARAAKTAAAPTPSAAAPVPRARRRRAEKTPEPPLAQPPSPHQPWEPVLAGMEEVGTGLLDRLDALQRVAASAPGGALLVVAGPGTGKTRTLTHRIAYLIDERGIAPEHCLAVTFTRRAA